MKLRKRIAFILVVLLVITMVPINNMQTTTQADAAFAITSPGNNKLIGAGSFDIKWSQATGGTVKDYKLYIDGEEEATVTDTSYEYYSTNVKMYSVYVTAEYTNGNTETTSTITFGVTKKGTCVDNTMGRYLNPADLNVGWYYDWNPNPISYSAFDGYDFVPMQWGATSATELSNTVQDAANKGYKYLLAFNEPDLKGQADFSISTGVSLWPALLNKGIKISSPATAIWPSASKDWFQPFMVQINNQVDYIAIHCYPDNNQGASGGKWFLSGVVDEAWEMYHKPIWITEFSTTGDQVTVDGCCDWMQVVMKGLDERPYVERYSWFSFNAGNNKSGLWNHDTGKLAEPGLVYAENGNPEGWDPDAVKEPTVPDSFSVQTFTKKNVFDDTTTINNVVCTNYITSNSGVTASASSESEGNKVSFAIDGNIKTRWGSEHKKDPSTITVDLGKVSNIKRIASIWESASAKDYDIEISTDGVNYTSVAKIQGASGGDNRDDEVTLNETTPGQFIRFNCTARTTDYGYSIKEIAVYGSDDTKVDETTTVKPVETTKRIPRPYPEDSTDQQQTTSKNTTTTKSTEESIKTTSNSSVTTQKDTTIDANLTTTEKRSPKLGTVKIKSASKTKKSKKALVVIKKVSGAKGYQVQVCTSKKFKKTITKNYSNTKITFKKLKANKKYYVRVRAYKILKNIKSYGKWSTKKKIKIKK